MTDNTNLPRRQKPRRNGKGSNATANAQALAKNGAIQSQPESLPVSTPDEIAVAGGDKSVGKILPFMKLENLWRLFQHFLC